MRESCLLGAILLQLIFDVRHDIGMLARRHERRSYIDLWLDMTLYLEGVHQIRLPIGHAVYQGLLPLLRQISLDVIWLLREEHFLGSRR